MGWAQWCFQADWSVATGVSPVLVLTHLPPLGKGVGGKLYGFLTNRTNFVRQVKKPIQLTPPLSLRRASVGEYIHKGVS